MRRSRAGRTVGPRLSQWRKTGSRLGQRAKNESRVEGGQDAPGCRSGPYGEPDEGAEANKLIGSRLSEWQLSACLSLKRSFRFRPVAGHRKTPSRKTK
jgi:hypothetical protein